MRRTLVLRVIAAATNLLFYRLQECASYEAADDEGIQRQVDAWYSRQPTFDTRHEEFLQSRLDLRDRCSALTRKQIDSGLDFARMALRRHDREMIITLGGAGSFSIEARS